MKKRIISVLLAIVFVITLILAYNVQLNLKIRRKAFEVTHKFDVVVEAPQTVFLETDEIHYTDFNDSIEAFNDASGEHYFNAKWLLSSGTTALYDEKLDKVFMEAPSMSLAIDAEGNTFINGKPTEVKIAVKRIEKEVFLPYESMMKLEAFESIGFNMKTGTNTIFYSDYLAYNQYEIGDKTPLFDNKDSLNTYNETLRTYIPFISGFKLFKKIAVSGIADHETVKIYSEGDQYNLVVTDRAEIGYVSGISEDYVTQKAPIKKSDVVEHYKEPIMLVWEAVYSRNPDTSLIQPMKGLNVVSPTWYALEDSLGNLSAKPSQAYVDWANDMGYSIWAMVTNDFDIDRTHDFLYDKGARENLIQTMIDEAKKYGYEGINIDFEHVYMADKDALTHFVNEFSKATKAAHLILSMDVTVMGGSDNWSKCYDHEALGNILDYLIVMTYDEYWASSPISGPVASYNWVERSINNLLEVVSPSKLIMGVPLYTRVWREYPSTEQSNKVKVKSKAIGMEAQNNFVEENNIPLVWDDTAKLYYGTFFEEDAQVKIWVENARTLSEKVKIAKLKELAGIAAWRRGFETDDIWAAMNNALRK